MVSDELVALVVECRAALAARDEELTTWETWAENIERRAHEELGHGQIHN